MTIPTVIKDPKSGNTARVTEFGQLVVAPIQYSTPVSIELNVIDTAFNFAVPKDSKSIVITDIIVSADKSVSATTPAEVEVYTSSSPESSVAINNILQPRLVRSNNLTLTGLNLLIDEGVWINAKTNDASILLTIMFYRVPVENL